MKHNLPSLLIGIGLFLAGLAVVRYQEVKQLASRFFPQETAEPIVMPRAVATASPPTLPPKKESPSKEDAVRELPGDGQALMQEAAKALQKLTSLEVKMRYKAIAFDQEVMGAGQYWQLGEGPEKLMRMDLKIASAGGDIFQQEVCTKDHFWTRKMLPLEEKAILERVDLLRLRTAIARVSQQDTTVESRAWMMLGGLPRILGQLEQSYTFLPPKTVQAKGGTLWLIRGRLRPDWVAALGNGKPEVTSELGEQVPIEVDVYLGKETIGPELFPFRIEYYRFADKQKKKSWLMPDEKAEPILSSQQEPLTLLMSLEFLQPQQDVDLDPRFFEFDPGDAEYDDGTQSCLSRLWLTRQ